MNYILSETEYNALKKGSQSNDGYYNEEDMRKDITYDVAYNVHNVYRERILEYFKKRGQKDDDKTLKDLEVIFDSLRQQFCL